MTTYPGQVSSPGAAAEPIAPIPQITIDAFSGHPRVSTALQQIGADRRMLRTTVNCHNGDIRAAINAYKTRSAPHLIITELSGNEAEMLASLEELAELCEAETKVIAIGHLNDVSLYRVLLNRGISDYLVAPVDPLGVIKAISNAYATRKADAFGRMMAVIGSKGGVGASTIAHNLAWTISNELVLSTLLIDLNIPFGTTALAFDSTPQLGVIEGLRQPERIDAALIERLSFRARERLNALAGLGDLSMMPNHAEPAVSSLLGIARQQVPAIVIDMPHNWNDWTQRVLADVDDVLIVAAPTMADLRNAKAMYAWLTNRRPADRPPHLALNMVGTPKRRELSQKDFLTALNAKSCWTIAHQPALFGQAADSGQMVSEVSAKGKANDTFAEIAYELMGRSREMRRGFGLGAILSRLRKKEVAKPRTA